MAMEIVKDTADREELREAIESRARADAAVREAGAAVERAKAQLRAIDLSLTKFRDVDDAIAESAAAALAQGCDLAADGRISQAIDERNEARRTLSAGTAGLALLERRLEQAKAAKDLAEWQVKVAACRVLQEHSRELAERIRRNREERWALEDEARGLFAVTRPVALAGFQPLPSFVELLHVNREERPQPPIFRAHHDAQAKRWREYFSSLLENADATL